MKLPTYLGFLLASFSVMAALPSGKFTNSIGMKLVKIPAGSFIMGYGTVDQPIHMVSITQTFHLAQTELTQGQWVAVMGTRPWAGEKHVQSGPNYPAVYVSWDDAQEFCRRLSAKEGKLYRLPSEAEWEYAARAGGEGKWCFGSEEGSLRDYAWYDKNAWGIGERYGHRVGTKHANAFGLNDMHGNVWEWCEDTYHDDYQGAPTDGSAWIGADVMRRVGRGGGFSDDAYSTRSSFRYGVSHIGRNGYIGFRVACGPRMH